MTDLNFLVSTQVDTNLESPDDFVKEGVAGVAESYNVAPFSSVLLESK